MSENPNYHIYLEQPHLIIDTEVDVFHNWVNQYPYTPIFRVLLAAKFMLEDHPDTAKYVEQAAFYVQDRKHLKQLLRKYKSQLEHIPNEETTQIESKIVDDIPIENEIQSDNEILTDSEEKELQEIIQSGTTTENETPDDISSPSTSEIQEEIQEEVINPSEEIVNEEIVEIQAIQNQEIVDATIEPLEEKVTEEAVEIPSEPIQETLESSIEPSENEEEINTISIGVQEEISEQDDINFLKSIHLYQEISSAEKVTERWHLETPGNIIPEISENAIIDNCISQTDIQWLIPWLDEFNTDNIELIVKQTAKVLEINNQEPEEKTQITLEKENLVTAPNQKAIDSNTNNRSFDEWLQILEQQKNNSKEAPVFDMPSPEIFPEAIAENLSEIDSTIPFSEASNPIPNTPENNQVKHLAEESVSFKNDMATETLAKLYERQGKIQLAIKIYQQLIDKYPEKSTYFAGQIKRLK
ncbi:MAG: hypothetical protein M9958_12880 [Chitinophagales bacterium]|nr:hypothetical protein [Chitinophagales bacterium]